MKKILKKLLGPLDFVIFSVIKFKTKCYGREIRSIALKKYDKSIPQSTIYVLLNRMEEKQFLKATWDHESGKPRKYYTITSKGMEAYKFTEGWFLELNKPTGKRKSKPNLVPVC